jgi:hypothetical protein
VARTAAVLDANVLYPVRLRDLFLRLAIAGHYKALWTERSSTSASTTCWPIDRTSRPSTCIDPAPNDRCHTGRGRRGLHQPRRQPRLSLPARRRRETSPGDRTRVLPPPRMRAPWHLQPGAIIGRTRGPSVWRISARSVPVSGSAAVSNMGHPVEPRTAQAFDSRAPTNRQPPASPTGTYVLRLRQ